jgi:ABC-type Mn2+/Zn2+ transport system permease subunit
MATILEFFQAFQYSYMIKSIITGIIIGVIGGLIGVFVLLKGMVFLGEAIAHSAFAGAALALLIGIDPIITILAFGVIAALGVGAVSEKKIMKDEIIIGIVFTSFMALAILLIGFIGTSNTSVQSILFGNILTVTDTSFYFLIFFAFAVLLIVYAFKKELYLITFNSEMAKVAGIPVRFLNYLFLVIVAVTINISLEAIGAILVFAMIITPAAAAYQWTFKLNKMIILATIFGVFSSLLGIFFSFILNIPSGSAIVAIATLIFIVSFIASPKRRKSGTGHVVEDCEFCSKTIAGKKYCIEENCIAKEIPHKHDEKGLLIYKTDIKVKEIPSQHKHEMEMKKNDF